MVLVCGRGFPVAKALLHHNKDDRGKKAAPTVNTLTLTLLNKHEQTQIGAAKKQAGFHIHF